MKIRRIEVRTFGAVDTAEVTFGEGLNVLFGPNDIGKSTLVHAMRLALLLPSTSTEGAVVAPWGADAVPYVRLEFRGADGALYRVEKKFDRSVRGGSELETSSDGATWTLIAKAREVDGQLRKLLGWGIPEPGGKGGTKGLPTSFLSRALLGEQAELDAILDQSLAEDKDELGRERLTEALGAYAQDPLFKSILDRATARVQEAFTSRGALRNAKSSPLKPVADAAKEAAKEAARARTLYEESEAVEAVAHALQQRLVAADAARQDAAKALERGIEAQAERDVYRAARERAAAAHAALATGEAAHSAVSRATDELAAARAASTAALAEVATREAGLQGAEAALRGAAAASAGEAEANERANILALERAEEAAKEQLRRAQAAARARDAERVAADAEREADQANAATAPRREAEDDARWCLAKRRCLDADEALERLRARAQEADDLRADAARRREEAGDTDAWVPTPTALAEVEALAHALEVAEARLSVGVRVRIETQPGGIVEVQSGERKGDVARAERHMTLAVSLSTGDPVATLYVEGGSADAHDEMERLQSEFEAHLRPLLERAEVDDLDALRAAVAARAAATERLAEAERLEQRASARLPDAADLDDAAARAATAADELARARAPEQVPDPLADVAALRAELEACESARASIESTASELRDTARSARAAAEAASAELARLGSLEGTVAVEDAEQQLRDAATATRAARDAMGAQEAAREAGLRVAEDAVTEAKRALGAARTRADEARQALGAREAALEAAVSASKEHDLGELGAAHEAATAALGELTEPEEVDMPRLRRELSEADATLAELRLEAERHRGKMESTGGSVAKEAHLRAMSALEDAEAEETRVRLDLDGWRLLRAALREAEDEDASHLGDALGASVGDRFDALMKEHGDASRYGRLAVDPNLSAGGVNMQGVVRPVDALSVGTREQLALLVRLTVAEALGAPLVLDDLLTHTDEARARWFRDTLRRAARTTQIIVVTCRPQDYLDDDERPEDAQYVDRAAGLVRAIDAARVLGR